MGQGRRGRRETVNKAWGEGRVWERGAVRTIGRGCMGWGGRYGCVARGWHWWGKGMKRKRLGMRVGVTWGGSGKDWRENDGQGYGRGETDWGGDKT